jgi:hypothetical protein
LTGWQPEETFFRNIEATPSVWKKKVLVNLKERFPDARFIAIESNGANDSMYVGEGVLSLRFGRPAQGEIDSFTEARRVRLLNCLKPGLVHLPGDEASPG